MKTPNQKPDHAIPIGDLLLQSSQKLQTISDSPLLDSQLLLANILNKDRSYLLAWSDVTLTETQNKRFKHHLLQRLQGIPIAYILGYKEFWSLKLTVTPDVLIPRPETELLVEQVLECCSTIDKPKILELGTGSGAIAIALACELKHANITASDVSATALSVAKENAIRLLSATTNPIRFIESDWFSHIPANRFDIIVSNPPYIEEKDPHLQSEIRFEPLQALVSGEDGLVAIRKLTTEAASFLKPTGVLLLEHGYNQGRNVREQMMAATFSSCQTVKDYSGNDRVTLAYR